MNIKVDWFTSEQQVFIEDIWRLYQRKSSVVEFEVQLKVYLQHAKRYPKHFLGCVLKALFLSLRMTSQRITFRRSMRFSHGFSSSATGYANVMHGGIKNVSYGFSSLTSIYDKFLYSTIDEDARLNLTLFSKFNDLKELLKILLTLP